MKKIWLILILIILWNFLFSQSIHISGRVFNKNGESIEGVSITANEYVTISDVSGYFSLIVPKQKSVNIKFSHLSFHPKEISLPALKDTFIVVILEPKAESIDEVVIYGQTNVIDNNNLSQINFPVQYVNTLPIVLGVKDILKSIQIMPGIQPGIEGTSNVNVRGGASYQNLYLMDDIPIYYISHFYGILSIFNPEAVKSLKIIKGAIPAQYTNFGSSVIDISMLDGNINKRQVSLNFNILAPSVSIQGPIIKNKFSTSLFYRRSALDYLIKELASQMENGNMNIYFEDFYNKYRLKLDNFTTLYLTLLANKDNYYYIIKDQFKDDSGFVYQDFIKQGVSFGNKAGALKFLTVVDNKFLLKNTFVYSLYSYNNISYRNRTNLSLDSLLAEFDNYLNFKLTYLTWKSNIKYLINNKLSFSLGHNLSYIIHNLYKISNYKVVIPETRQYLVRKDIKLSEKTVSSHFAVYSQLNFNYNLISGFLGVVWNSFSNNELKKEFNYNFIEPRINLAFAPFDSFKLQFSYTLSHQFLHVIESAAIATPGDIFMPSTQDIPPEELKIYDFGITYNKNNFTISLNGYYKQFANLLAYNKGINILDVDIAWEKYVAIGNGKSYGIEFMLNKKSKKLDFLTSITLSRSFRQFNSINNDLQFPYKFDRPIIINLTGNYKLSKKLKLSVIWTYYSGYWLTIPQKLYQVGFTNFGIGYLPIEYYERINNVRTPDYHRLDISFNYHKPGGRGYLQFGIYNVYNRLNPTFMEVTWDGKLKGVTLFPFMPFVSYKYEIKW